MNKTELHELNCWIHENIMDLCVHRWDTDFDSHDVSRANCTKCGEKGYLDYPTGPGDYAGDLNLAEQAAKMWKERGMTRVVRLDWQSGKLAVATCSFTDANQPGSGSGTDWLGSAALCLAIRDFEENVD